MTDLNKIQSDLQDAIENEKNKIIVMHLNHAAGFLATAIQLQGLYQNSNIDIEKLGIGNDRVSQGRRHSDVK